MLRIPFHRPPRLLAVAAVTTLTLTTLVGSSSLAASRLAAPSPGAADAPVGFNGVTVTTTMTDRDDTHGRLDVRSVRHRVIEIGRSRVRVAYRLQTFKPFRGGLLDSPDREFVIELHRTTTRGADRNINVSSVDGGLVATVISNATREPIARARIDRLGRDTVRVTGSRRLIGARSYFVTSNFHQGGSARCGWDFGWPVTCQDTVPDRGWIRVDRLGWPETT